MPKPKLGPSPHITHVAMTGDHLVIEFGPDIKLVLVPHIRWRSHDTIKEHPYVEEAILIDYHRVGGKIAFEEGGRRGRVLEMAHGYSQMTLASYWSAAAAYIRGTDFPEAIKQVIAAGDPMLEATVHQKFPVARPLHPGPVKRLARALHVPHLRPGIH